MAEKKKKKGKTKGRRQWVFMLRSSLMAAAYLFFAFTLSTTTSAAEESSPRKQLGRKLVDDNRSMSFPDVHLRKLSHGRVAMDNGIVQIILSSPDGDVIGVKYNNIDNLLEIHNDYDDRGYWDVVWNSPNKRSATDSLKGKNFKVITSTVDQLELSFSKTWDSSSSADSSSSSSAPLNVDKRYILRRGNSGFYAYAIFERLDGWPAIDIDQIRIVYKLREDKFDYMAVSDDRQRMMPSPEDRQTGRRLDYPEAVLLTHPTNARFRGEVDDKYQYSMENQDNKVHGWTCSNPSVGFWMITPSDEFRVAGPVKQDLTSHVGPVTLNMFVSTHYAGKEVGMKFEKGEAWKKVFGPVFIYLNSASHARNNRISLWKDAKNQMGKEVASWPYDFVRSKYFPSAGERGEVSGQLKVKDSYATKSLALADSAYVGLAAQGDAGSWQRESKGYQFWTRADRKGFFSIQNIRPGHYNLYAWVPGFIGDFKFDSVITILPGKKIWLNNLVFSPPRRGPTLWEIGIPDRTAGEFYIPDPQPTLMNRMYSNRNPDKFRQYGLWRRYADIYPKEDLVYTVGSDDYRRDWFFAHVTRNTGNGKYKSTTWQIVFSLRGPKRSGNYTLQLALASATDSIVQVRFNKPATEPAHFSTGPIGKDNAIARHGIHGLYWLFSIDVPSELLREEGEKNVLYLRQPRNWGPFTGVMYDYIRFEGPSSLT